jgi:DNA-binding MarR family transcriptional regulator
LKDEIDLEVARPATLNPCVARTPKPHSAGKIETLTRELDAIMSYSAATQLRAARQGGLKLSRQESFAVNALGRSGPATMGTLAKKLSSSMSALTAIVDRLVDHGIVSRERSEEDRRIVRITLTAKGLSLYQEHLKTQLDLSRKMLSCLSPREQDALLDILRKIVEGLSDKLDS